MKEMYKIIIHFNYQKGYYDYVFFSIPIPEFSSLPTTNIAVLQRVYTVCVVPIFTWNDNDVETNEQASVNNHSTQLEPLPDLNESETLDYLSVLADIAESENSSLCIYEDHPNMNQSLSSASFNNFERNRQIAPFSFSHDEADYVDLRSSSRERSCNSQISRSSHYDRNLRTSSSDEAVSNPLSSTASAPISIASAHSFADVSEQDFVQRHLPEHTDEHPRTSSSNVSNVFPTQSRLLGTSDFVDQSVFNPTNTSGATVQTESNHTTRIERRNLVNSRIDCIENIDDCTTTGISNVGDNEHVDDADLFPTAVQSNHNDVDVINWENQLRIHNIRQRYLSNMHSPEIRNNAFSHLNWHNTRPPEEITESQMFPLENEQNVYTARNDIISRLIEKGFTPERVENAFQHFISTRRHNFSFEDLHEFLRNEMK
ncbi:uncharacterized protein LOC127725304 [Mytilus californianus]|uniref:uncharacterized protein LOC127725304 n=1 Tax=Mytilus californianus TaxID=6549 RepID=UPI002247ECA8|nr:uncharacterized protein LOC127725304 [Mytilus californianus]